MDTLTLKANSLKFTAKQAKIFSGETKYIEFAGAYWEAGNAKFQVSEFSNELTVVFTRVVGLTTQEKIAMSVKVIDW